MNMTRKSLCALAIALCTLYAHAQETARTGTAREILSSTYGNSREFLPMGFNKNWEGRVIINHEGGYNGNFNNIESNIHGWEQLHEALAGDVYVVTMPTAARTAENARLQFHAPITIDPGHKYQIRATLLANRNIPGATFTVSQGDRDDNSLGKASADLVADEPKTLTKSNLTGKEIINAKLDFRFPTTEDSTVIRISNIRIYDQTARKNLWQGTSYFNWCYYADPATGKRIKDMKIEGRTETLSWTRPDYDDSMWQAMDMPIGNAGYMPEIRSEWPGGDNTNLWVRRDFTLDEVDKRARYTLKVCHDDCYRVYVNGHLVDSDQGWTDGKNYMSIPIPEHLLQKGNNVIATYIQQNWGGMFYDCGMSIEPDYYEESDEDADPASLAINEVQVRNVDQYVDWSFNYGSWIELYNPTDKRIPLSGLWLSVDAATPCQFQLTQEAGVVPAKGYKTLFFGHHKDDGTYGATADRQVRLKLSNDGGTVLLSDRDGKVISSVTYPLPTSRCSYARTTDGGTQWGTTGNPTPGATNAGSAFASQRLAPPEPDTDSRLFNQPFTMHVPIPEGCTLRYTIDGSTPTLQNGFTCTGGEFRITSTLTMRFAFFADGFLPSRVVSRSYILSDKDYYLPILSILTAPSNLYDDSLGVYVDGVNGVSGRNHGKSNKNMDWERPVNVEYLTPDGTELLNQEAEFKVAGGWSRHFAPASFKLKASKTYEGDKSLNARLFPHKPYNRYKEILVRNGGNDNEDSRGGRVADVITQQTLTRSAFMVDAQEYQPVHVFFNGSYMGQLNLREPSNRYHGTANYGYDDDRMDAFEYSNGYVQTSGTKDAFDNWVALSADAADSAAYGRLCQVVDMDEYTNYWAAVAYIGCDDWICNHNNVKGYRSLDDGRFHLVLLDQDFGWRNANALSLLEGNTSNELLTIYNNTKRNKTWQRKFVDAFCLVDGSVFTPDRCQAVGDSICALVGKALGYEKRDPQYSFDKQRTAMTSETVRKARMNDLRKNFNLPEGMRVSFHSNIPQAQFRLNGQPVPLSRFDGTLFPPARIEASAPAGYNFVGWRTMEDNPRTVSTNRILCLEENAPEALEAVFEPLKASALADAGVHPVVINEVSAGNSIFQNDLFKRADWVELYNTTAEDIDLTGMMLSNSTGNPGMHVIRASSAEDGSAIIPAHGHKIVWMDNEEAIDQLHASFKLKNEDGCLVMLTAADHSWSDTLTYERHMGVESVGRYPDGGKRVFRMKRPTIGNANWLSESAEWLYGEDANFDDSAYPTGIRAAGNTSEIVRTEYFTTDGLQLPSPRKGINIIRHTHRDGSVTHRKVLLAQ